MSGNFRYLFTYKGDNASLRVKQGSHRRGRQIEPPVVKPFELSRFSS
jgi:hypothetical protein